jgi:hypothetical protein
MGGRGRCRRRRCDGGFLVQSLLRVIAPDLTPQLAGVGGEGQQVLAGGGKVFGRFGVVVGQGGHDAVELGVHRVGVGLVEDGADLRSHGRLGGFRHLGQQVAQVMTATALPRRARQRRADRRDQSGVGIGGD